MEMAVVSFAIQRLGDLLISEARFLTGVSQQVGEIQSQLKDLQSFLKDADRKRENARVRKWVEEVREVALMTEDVLETYALGVQSRREGGKFEKLLYKFACIFCEGITLHKTGMEIRIIQDKIAKLATSTQTVGLQPFQDGTESSNAENERQQMLRVSYSHLPEKDFVGMEEEIQQLISHLKREDNGCEVVSIWGMGGQGKTTLATKVYNHNDVLAHFQATAWVCVTQKFERQRVLQDILKGLLSKQRNDEIMGMGETELVEELYKVQIEKRCLVVIDDIWSLDDWKILRPAFPTGVEVSSSKILVTTRKEGIPNVGSAYKLRSLTDEEGWKLLCIKAFGLRHNDPDAYAENRMDPKKEDIGKNMVRKCQGLPLAISALGGLLQNKSQLREWEMVNLDISSHLCRAEGTEYGNVRQILALSYEDLPFRYKQLFLYLGNFKEGKDIETSDLYQLWIAEGMVCLSHQAKGEMLMDVAERYLLELAQRSLVQLRRTYLYVTDTPWINFDRCRLHDMVRDLCLSKGKEEDILNIIDFQDPSTESLDSLTVVLTKVRRLVIYLYNDTNTHVPLEQQHVLGQLRSLLFFNNQLLPLKVKNLKQFKLIRVLKLERFKFNKGQLPQGLSYLIHLRYLSFRYSVLLLLPTSIACLRYLETLDLRVSGENQLSIPNVLTKLKMLKHLYLPLDYRPHGSKNSLELLEFDGLNALELLVNVFGLGNDMDALAKLTKLQVLEAHVWRSEQLTGIMNFLLSDVHHHRYTTIIISNSDLNSEPLERPGTSHLTQLLQCNSLNKLRLLGGVGCLPKNFSSHCLSESLVHIRLHNCKYEDDPMVIFETLPNIRQLVFLNNSYMGKEVVCSSTGFPRLSYLEFHMLPNLEKWSIDEGGMPNLQKLIVDECCKLKMLPEGLKSLNSLRVLQLFDMPKAFTDRISDGRANGEEGEDFYKVCRIPFVHLKNQEMVVVKGNI